MSAVLGWLSLVLLAVSIWGIDPIFAWLRSSRELRIYRRAFELNQRWLDDPTGGSPLLALARFQGRP